MEEKVCESGLSVGGEQEGMEERVTKACCESLRGDTEPYK